MGAWGLPRRAREPQDRSAAASGVGTPARPPPSPYSDQYETIVAQGHTRPTPTFGAPALVWHVGIGRDGRWMGPTGRPSPAIHTMRQA
jgi:hypothetical protein